MRLRSVTIVVGMIAIAAGAATVLAQTQWESAPALDVTGLSATRLGQAATRAKSRVILVTIDGARWQDVFHQGRTLSQTPAMPKLLAAAKQNGVVRRAVTSTHRPKSLPGYQAIYAGAPTDCVENTCPRTTQQTLLDDVAPDAAVFTSWSLVQNAFKDGTGATVNAPPLGQGATPWKDARFDKETIALGLAYWREHHPRFFHLALLDMDEWAHEAEPDAVVSSLRQADDAIAALVDLVHALPPEEAAATTILVTEDHGRGPGPLWTSHSKYASSRNMFVIAIGDPIGPEWSITQQSELRSAILALLAAKPTGG